MFSTILKSQPKEDICLLFNVDNHPWNYICECGEASDLTVKDCQNANAIFISHTHIDHFINFDQILRHQIGIQRRVTICGPKGIAAQVQARIKGYTWNLIQKGAIIYEIREIVSVNEIHIYEVEPPIWALKKIGTLTQNTIFKNDKFQTNFTILDHKTPSIAYRFKQHDSINMNIAKSGFNGGKWVRTLKEAFKKEDKKVQLEIEEKELLSGDLFHLLERNTGATFGIIMDHAANADNHLKIKSLFQNCDKVFIESFYKAADIEMATTNFHSYSMASGQIMRECEVREAIPVHFSRRYEAADLELLRAEFEQAFDGA
ncbi:MAG: ribonuclease Z [Paraglaciecola sp.]|jgi:ribonuclease Z